ncbi:hypothetical protein [Prosthecomicrobium hirschii]|uniref:hypothetical protein n=1 Tax=Prosthecodimorpha hirschii TaxID=665126 RepID=UPI00221F3064|nr:hypothetical protein [Prosthecomicrobium hirschii]MCW1839473.1 hypothetical protein [Prosthecomicrobium hirschii]
MTVKLIRRAMDLLPLLTRGRFIERLDEAIGEAVESLEQRDKGSATLTITLTFTQVGDRLDIKPAVKSKLPEAEPLTATPFWTIDGKLSVQHPSQVDMFAGPRGLDRDTA